MSKPTLKIILDTKSKQPKRKVFLQITYKRKAYQYSLGIDEKLSKEEFDNKRLNITKAVYEKANPLLMKAQDIVNELGDSFNFDKFKVLWKGQNLECDMSSDLLSIYHHYILNAKIAEGTKRSYLTAVNSLNRFRTLKITEWTKDYIRGYVSELEKQGHSADTIGIYLRSIKVLYNYAKDSLKLDDRIFAGIRIHQTTRKNKVLTKEEFIKFRDYVPANGDEEFAKDFFFISFTLSGANIADILLLKSGQFSENIQNKTWNVYYYREKTKNSLRIKEPILLVIPSSTIERILKYGVINPSSPNEYVFPFINHTMTEKQILMKRKDINKKINRGLKSILMALQLPHFTLYSARHTVTTLLVNGTDIKVPVISKTLGHTTIGTTQHYIHSLSPENLHQVSQKIDMFLNEDNW